MRYMRFLFQIGAILLWVASASAGPTTITGKVTAKRGQTYQVQFEPSESARPRVGDVVDFSLEIQGIKVKAGNGSVTRVEENSVWVDIAPTSRSKPRLNATGIIHATGKPKLPAPPAATTGFSSNTDTNHGWDSTAPQSPALKPSLAATQANGKTAEKTPAKNAKKRLMPASREGREKYLVLMELYNNGGMDRRLAYYNMDSYAKEFIGEIYSADLLFLHGKMAYEEAGGGKGKFDYLFNKAVENLKLYLDTYSAYAHKQIPDAMYMLGVSYAKIKKEDEARKILRDLISEYPGSNATHLAEKQLERLK